jgi:regulatory protein
MGEPASAADVALRALRHRDLSRRELEERLRAKGFGESERGGALETLERTGLLDDRRFAESRARSLASRGAGDALIRYTLARAGVDDELVDQALETIEPESERARALAARRGADAKTARYLRGKGFSDDVVAGVIAGLSNEELG